MAQVKRAALMSAVTCQPRRGRAGACGWRSAHAIERVGAAISNIEKHGAAAARSTRCCSASSSASCSPTMASWRVPTRCISGLSELNARLGRSESRGDLRNRRMMATILLDWGEPREAMAMLDAIAPRVRDIAPGAAPPDWLELPPRPGADPARRAGRGEATLRATAERRAGQRRPEERGARRLPAGAGTGRRRPPCRAADALLDRLASRLDTVQRQVTPATLRAAIRLGQGRVAEARTLIDAELRRLGHPGAVSGIAGAAARARRRVCSSPPAMRPRQRHSPVPRVPLPSAPRASPRAAPTLARPRC